MRILRLFEDVGSKMDMKMRNAKVDGNGNGDVDECSRYP